MQVVNFFYELARQHKRIKGFYYGKSYEKGAANDNYPLMWLDDPIYGNAIGPDGSNPLAYTCNVDILGIPANNTEVLAVQSEAFTVGLTLAEKIKQTRKVTGFYIGSYSFVSLRDYYDDNAAGYRFTYRILQANPVDRCNEDFDPNKQLPRPDTLPDFNTDNPDGCAIFNNKSGLPNFKINE